MRKKAKISNGVDINSQPKEPAKRKFLLGAIIVLLCVFGISLWKAQIRKAPVKTEELAEPLIERPVKPAKNVLRSRLAGRHRRANQEGTETNRGPG